jgi:chloramphenicol-sensitive protein RarD
VGGFVGLAVETTLLCPLALAYLGWLTWQGKLGFGTGGARQDGLVIFVGAVTTLPLFCFGEATRRLPLSTLGILQYISPSVQLLLAVRVYGEEFGRVKAACFGCIWMALAVFTITALQQRTVRPAAEQG